MANDENISCSKPYIIIGVNNHSKSVLGLAIDNYLATKKENHGVQTADIDKITETLDRGIVINIGKQKVLHK